MKPQQFNIPTGKKIYFASDFHLGVPDKASSLIREKKIVNWLTAIEKDAEMIFLVGDIFDFWYEYRYTIPKGYIRLQGKLAALSDKGIKVVLFTGNHDMWMFDYFTSEFNIPVYHHPVGYLFNNKKFLIGHGDGLGPGDSTYKILKKIFRNPICIFLFGQIHPNTGMRIANFWSRNSRISKQGKEEFLGDDEWIYQYCKDTEKKNHFDYYIFGHRHLPLDLPVNSTSRYLNLGEWMNYFTYGVFDGNDMELKTFQE